MKEGKLAKALRLTLGGVVCGYAVVFFATLLLAFVFFPWASKEAGSLVIIGALFFAPIGSIVGLYVGAVEAWVRRNEDD